MPLVSRIPQIIVQSTLAAQRAVDEAGQHVEFLALERAARRRRSGKEMGLMRWRVDKRNPHTGYMNAGAFYTRFGEYGTINQSAQPILGPAAEEAFPGFVADMQRAWR